LCHPLQGLQPGGTPSPAPAVPLFVRSALGPLPHAAKAASHNAPTSNAAFRAFGCERREPRHQMQPTTTDPTDPMRVIIAGGRDYVPTFRHIARLDTLKEQLPITEVVCGMANGADCFGYLWAKMRGIPVREFPADWTQHGKAAGHLRNAQMAAYGQALVAFRGGKGTANMLDQAAKCGLKVVRIDY